MAKEPISQSFRQTRPRLSSVFSMAMDNGISEEREEESFVFGHRYMVTPRSFLLFRLESDGTTGGAGEQV